MATNSKEDMTNMDHWMDNFVDMINNTVPSNGTTKHLLKPDPKNQPPDLNVDASSTDSDSEDIDYLLDIVNDTETATMPTNATIGTKGVKSNGTPIIP